MPKCLLIWNGCLNPFQWSSTGLSFFRFQTWSPHADMTKGYGDIWEPHPNKQTNSPCHRIMFMTWIWKFVNWGGVAVLLADNDFSGFQNTFNFWTWEYKIHLKNCTLNKILVKVTQIIGRSWSELVVIGQKRFLVNVTQMTNIQMVCS